MPVISLFINFNATNMPEKYENNTHTAWILSQTGLENTFYLEIAGVASNWGNSKSLRDYLLDIRKEYNSQNSKEEPRFFRMMTHVIEGMKSFTKKTRQLYDLETGNGVFIQALLAAHEIFKIENTKFTPGERLTINIYEYGHSRGCLASLIFSQLVEQFFSDTSRLFKVLHDPVPGGNAQNNPLKSFKDYAYEIYRDWVTKNDDTTLIRWQDEFGTQKPELYQFIQGEPPSCVKATTLVYAQNETRYMFDIFIPPSGNRRTTILILPSSHNDLIYGNNATPSLQPFGLEIKDELIQNNGAGNISDTEKEARQSLQAFYLFFLKVTHRYYVFLASLPDPNGGATFEEWLYKLKERDLVKKLLNEYIDFKTSKTFEKFTLTPGYTVYQSSSVRDLRILNNEAEYKCIFYDKFHENLFLAFYKSAHFPEKIIRETLAALNERLRLTNTGEQHINYPIRTAIDAGGSKILALIDYAFQGLIGSYFKKMLGEKSTRMQEIDKRFTSHRCCEHESLKRFLQNPTFPISNNLLKQIGTSTNFAPLPLMQTCQIKFVYRTSLTFSQTPTLYLAGDFNNWLGSAGSGVIQPNDTTWHMRHENNMWVCETLLLPGKYMCKVVINNTLWFPESDNIVLTIEDAPLPANKDRPIQTIALN